MNKQEYIDRHYRVILCELCGKADSTLYFNEAGEAICEDCIEPEEDDNGE